MIDRLERALRPVMDRVRGIATRGRVERVTEGGDDRLGQLQVNLGGDDIRDGVTHAQPYGFGSRPRPGAEVFMAWQAGARLTGWALVTDDRRGRPSLEEGEAIMYNAVAGTLVHLRADGSIKIKGDVVIDGNVSVNGDTHLMGDVVVDGKIAAAGSIADAVGTMDEIRLGFNAHTHTTPAGPTGPPMPPLPAGGGS